MQIMHTPTQLLEVAFVCQCGDKFKREPDRVEDFPEDQAHPWAYFSTCRKCGEEATQVAWQRNLMKAYLNSTGPKTEEGKAISAANLEGHPTPEEAARTRFNAMKHGVYARTATYFPAKPGKYPQCDGCQFIYSCVRGDPCQKRTELFMRHHVAVETGNPKLLSALNADMQASVHAIMQDMLISIVGTGVEIREPTWYYDKDGSCHFVKYKDEKGTERQLYDISAHPLLKPLMDFLSKNNMTLGDMNLTAKQQDDDDTMMGHLDNNEASTEKSLDYQRRSTEALEGLSAAVQRGKERLARDPILLEHGEQ